MSFHSAGICRGVRSEEGRRSSVDERGDGTRQMEETVGDKVEGEVEGRGG